MKRENVLSTRLTVANRHFVDPDKVELSPWDSAEAAGPDETMLQAGEDSGDPRFQTYAQAIEAERKRSADERQGDNGGDQRLDSVPRLRVMCSEDGCRPVIK